jgi:hypothetical protein
MRAMSHSPAYVHPEQKAVHSKAIIVSTDTTTKELSPRERRFLTAFLETLVPAAAARKAGYSKSTAAKKAQEIIRRPHIAQAIVEARKAEEGQACRTRDQWLKHIDKHCDHRDPKIRIKALELLGKAMGYNEPEMHGLIPCGPLVTIIAPSTNEPQPERKP